MPCASVPWPAAAGLAPARFAREEERRRLGGSFPNLKRPFEAADWQPTVARAREVGKDHRFKRVNDEETNHRFGERDRDSMRQAGGNPTEMRWCGPVL